MMKLSAEYLRRTEQALEETKTLLARALRYRADLQNAELVAFYYGHIAKLEKAIETGEIEL